MTALDTSKDGMRSRAEITAAVTALDLDKDGSLQRSELAALKAAVEAPAIALFLHGHGAGRGDGPTPAPQVITSLVGLFFTRVDADISGALGNAELLARAVRGLSAAERVAAHEGTGNVELVGVLLLGHGPGHGDFGG